MIIIIIKGGSNKESLQELVDDLSQEVGKVYSQQNQKEKQLVSFLKAQQL
jgi:hypothetical protein